jgi:hypothetical protein
MRPTLCLFVALGLLLSGTTHQVAAQDCTKEIEPNEMPDTALAIAGAVCHSGTLDADDLLDHYLWTVSPEDARQRWEVAVSSVEGVPATVTVTSVTSDAAAPTIALGQAVSEARPAEDMALRGASTQVLLPAGRYLVSVTPSAPPGDATTRYQLDLEPGPPFPESADKEPNDDPVSATPLEGAFEVSGDALGSVDHIAWQPGGPVTGELWAVEALGPWGRSIALTVLDADGEIIGDVYQEPDGTARIPDLGLGPGPYIIRVTSLITDVTPYILRTTRREGSGADPEPNDTPARALPIAAGELTTGRLARVGDVDTYKLVVDAALGSVMLDAKLILRSGPPRRLCLARLDPDAGAGALPHELGCDDGAEAAALTGLVLRPGDYILTVSGGASQLDPYYLRVDAGSAPQAGFELEPNDQVDLATLVDPDVGVTGRLDTDAADYFRVHVEGEPQLWEVVVAGRGAGLYWVRTDGAALGVGVDPDGLGERSFLTDVYLIPGDHWFSLRGSGDYTLTTIPLGPPVPGGEREPNNDLAVAEPLAIDGTITGRIGTASDQDIYRFSLAAPEHVRIVLEPPAGASLSMFAGADTASIVTGRSTRAPGEPIDLDLLLPAGDHAVRVVGAPMQGRYRISLSRADPFDVAVDQEPNDRRDLARPVPADLHVTGSGGWGDDADWYRLGPLPAAGQLTFETTGEIGSITLHDGSLETALVPGEDRRGYLTPSLAAGADISFGIVARGPYDLSIDPGGTGLSGAPLATMGDLPVVMDLALATLEVAAFESLGQRVAGSLTVTNEASEAVDLTLDSAVSQPDWSIGFGEARLGLQAGETAEVPVTVSVPADARADLPVRVTIRASDGAQASTTGVDLTPTVGGQLVDPVRAWDLPLELLGGLDAASAGLGAVPLVAIDPVAESALHDGVIALGGGLDVVTTLPLTLAVDLAADEPVPVAGTILDPSAGPGMVAGTVRGFQLLLSQDGITYQTALSGELSGALGEQPFVLSEPVAARFAQLRITSRFPGSDRLRLGEWKVVATPGWAPDSEALDIADPGLGGHVAWVDPQPGGPGSLDRMLDADIATLADWLPFDPERSRSVSWVLGFQDGRAAQVAELQWADPVSTDPVIRLRRIELAASLDGPLGPWAPLGTWDLARDGSGAVAPFLLEAPTWARYIRMTARTPEPSRGVVELPAAIRLLEADASDTFRSVAGEWGYGSPAGPFEWAQGGEVDTVEEVAAGAASPEAQGTDRALLPGDRVSGRVSRGQDVDWYALTIPADQVTARFVVSGRPSVGVGLALYDESGAEVPMGLEPGARPGTVEHVASVSPGSSYRLRVEQPPFSVVVAYDTSTSVAQYVPVIAGALRAYTRGLVPGEEALQLIDLEASPLLDDFSDDGWLLQNRLDAHTGSQTGSSSAETGLIDAAKLLATREGARAVLLLTDAETSSYQRNTEAWQWLGAVGPRVFAVHVGGAFSPVQNERMMQDWAAAAGGAYQYARSIDAVDESFDRMAAWLRRPADYGLVMELSSEPVEPPEPGSLRVVSPDDGILGAPSADGAAPAAVEAAAVPDVAVELVLDTSGSMLKRLGRERRIDVAKSVLRDLVNEQLRAGTPVALRTFRPVALSCETELAVPLGQLDPASMIATIDALTIPKSVRTPLAAAIAAVGDDLASVTGPRVVVVVSDGRESCGGDPEAAVRSLIEQGFDVSVNVVGLGLDRKSRKTIARLADVGNGHYYDARSASDLRDALRAAFGAPYEVLDASGAVVGNGTVDGAPMELLPGAYRVRLVGTEPVTLDVIIVEAGRAVTLVAPP